MLHSSLLALKTSGSVQDFSRALQQRGNIFYSEPDAVWVVSNYDLAKQILTDPNFSSQLLPYFAQRMPDLDIGLVGNFVAVASKMMVLSDAPQHTGRRRICYHAFTAQLIAGLQPKIAAAIDFALSNDYKRIDIATEYAESVSAAVLADIFLVPEAARREFFYWSHTMTQFFGGAAAITPAYLQEVNNCAKNLHMYFNDLIQSRRSNATDDFMSVMLHYQQDYNLTDDEVISQAIMMLVAGQVTTADQFCNIVYQLLATPGLVQQLQQQQNYSAAVDELTRIDPAVCFVNRIVINACEVAGHKLQAGAVVLIANFAVNHDPKQFVDPYQIKLARDNNKHMSYGFGTHFCLGSKLAKIMLVNMLQALTTKMPRLQLDPKAPPIKKVGSLGFSGYEQLYVVDAA